MSNVKSAPLIALSLVLASCGSSSSGGSGDPKTPSQNTPSPVIPVPLPPHPGIPTQTPSATPNPTAAPVVTVPPSVNPLPTDSPDGFEAVFNAWKSRPFKSCDASELNPTRGGFPDARSFGLDPKALLALGERRDGHLAVGRRTMGIDAGTPHSATLTSQWKQNLQGGAAFTLKAQLASGSCEIWINESLIYKELFEEKINANFYFTPNTTIEKSISEDPLEEKRLESERFFDFTGLLNTIQKSFSDELLKSGHAFLAEFSKQPLDVVKKISLQPTNRFVLRYRLQKAYGEAFEWPVPFPIAQIPSLPGLSGMQLHSTALIPIHYSGAAPTDSATLEFHMHPLSGPVQSQVKFDFSTTSVLSQKQVSISFGNPETSAAACPNSYQDCLLATLKDYEAFDSRYGYPKYLPQHVFSVSQILYAPSLPAETRAKSQAKILGRQLAAYLDSDSIADLTAQRRTEWALARKAALQDLQNLGLSPSELDIPTSKDASKWLQSLVNESYAARVALKHSPERTTELVMAWLRLVENKKLHPETQTHAVNLMKIAQSGIFDKAPLAIETLLSDIISREEEPYHLVCASRAANDSVLAFSQMKSSPKWLPFVEAAARELEKKLLMICVTPNNIKNVDDSWTELQEQIKKETSITPVTADSSAYVTLSQYAWTESNGVRWSPEFYKMAYELGTWAQAQPEHSVCKAGRPLETVVCLNVINTRHPFVTGRADGALVSAAHVRMMTAFYRDLNAHPELFHWSLKTPLETLLYTAGYLTPPTFSGCTPENFDSSWKSVFQTITSISQMADGQAKSDALGALSKQFFTGPFCR